MQKGQIELSARCPIRTAMDLLAGKWKLLLIYQLSSGPKRFSELARLLPDASEKMLAQELKQLTINQLVERPGTDRRGAYYLLALGAAALPVLAAVRDFGLACNTAQATATMIQTH